MQPDRRRLLARRADIALPGAGVWARRYQHEAPARVPPCDVLQSDVRPLLARRAGTMFPRAGVRACRYQHEAPASVLPCEVLQPDMGRLLALRNDILLGTRPAPRGCPQPFAALPSVRSAAKGACVMRHS